jgi:hypothetical protein
LGKVVYDKQKDKVYVGNDNFEEVLVVKVVRIFEGIVYVVDDHQTGVDNHQNNRPTEGIVKEVNSVSEMSK